MHCTNCGAPNRDAARFCLSCGAALEPPPPAPRQPDYGAWPPVPPNAAAPGPIQPGWPPAPGQPGAGSVEHCGQCGRPNVEQSRFCLRCGAALSGAASAPFSTAVPGQQLPGQERSKSRQGATGWIVAGVACLALLALVAAGWLLSRGGLSGSPNAAAQLMPARPNAYAVVSPSASQLARLADTGELEILGLPLALFSLADPEEIGDSLDQYDIDFDRDIRPWMGPEAAAAIYGLDEYDTTLVVAIATRDEELSGDFLRAVQDAMEDEGAEFDRTSYRGIPIAYEVDGTSDALSLATINGFVVGTSTLEAMKNVIDASEERTGRLAEDPDFLAMTERLPGNRVGVLYAEDMAQVLAGRLNRDWLPATEAVAVALQLEASGLRLELVQEMNLRDLRGDALDAIQRPATGARLVEFLPADTAIMGTGSDFARVWRQLALDVPGLLDESVNATLSNYREMYGVDLENDLFERLTGDYAVAILDGSDRVTDWPNSPEVSFLLAFDVPVEERRSIENAMQDLQNGVGAAMGWSAQEITGGDSRVHTVEAPSGVPLAGYSWQDDTLLVAVGESAVAALARPGSASLASETTYRQSMAALPTDAQSVFYMDMEQFARRIRDDAGADSGASERGSLVWYLEQAQALSSASAPVDDDGYQNTVIYLHMPNP